MDMPLIAYTLKNSVYRVENAKILSFSVLIMLIKIRVLLARNVFVKWNKIFLQLN